MPSGSRPHTHTSWRSLTSNPVSCPCRVRSRWKRPLPPKVETLTAVSQPPLGYGTRDLDRCLLPSRGRCGVEDSFRRWFRLPVCTHPSFLPPTFLESVSVPLSPDPCRVLLPGTEPTHLVLCFKLHPTEFGLSSSKERVCHRGPCTSQSHKSKTTKVVDKGSRGHGRGRPEVLFRSPKHVVWTFTTQSGHKSVEVGLESGYGVSQGSPTCSTESVPGSSVPTTRRRVWCLIYETSTNLTRRSSRLSIALSRVSCSRGDQRGGRGGGRCNRDSVRDLFSFIPPGLPTSCPGPPTKSLPWGPVPEST